MYLIRDVFRCKPGKSREVVERFARTLPSMEALDGLQNCRVMLDFVVTYWTVVLQAEVEDLGNFEHHMQEYRARPEVKEALAGYLELVEAGHREIYRLL